MFHGLLTPGLNKIVLSNVSCLIYCLHLRLQWVILEKTCHNMFSHINKNEHYCYTRIKYRIQNINKNIIQIYNYI